MSSKTNHPFRTGACNLGRVLVLAGLLATTLMAGPAALAADEDGFDSLLGLAASEASTAAGKQVESAQEAAVEAVKGDIESRVIWAIVGKKGMDSAVAVERAYDGLMEEVDSINKKLEVIDYAIEKYSKIAKGEYSDLAVDLWKEAVNKVAASEAAKELFKQIGISSNVVGLAVRALEITADSYLELHKRTADTKLESLYGAIEQDPQLFKGKKSGRELGTGNPIPVSREAVDHVFNRISTDSGFRDRFKIYVEQELNATFPTPDFFDSMLILAQTGGGREGGAAVESETQRALAKNKDDIESWIRALLAQLNSHAKLREAAFVAEKQLQEMQRAKASFQAMKQRIASLRASAASATAKIPEMRTYIGGIPARIAQAEKDKDASPLRAARGQIAEYVSRDLAAMPASPVRTELVSAFRSSWAAVNKSMRTIPELVETKMKEDATKAASAVEGASQYSFTPVTVTFNMKIDEVRGELDQAKNGEELNKAIQSVGERISNAWQDWERARRTGYEAISSYSSNESQSARISSALREQYRTNKISKDEYDAQSKALNAALQRWQIPTNAAYEVSKLRYEELGRQVSEVYGNRKALFDNGDRELSEFVARLDGEVTKLWTGSVQAKEYRRGNTSYMGTTVSITEAGELFDSLKSGISYAGLPQMNPPKWDAARPEKLLQYLYTLRGNITNEKYAVDQSMSRFAVAEELAGMLKTGKAVSDAIKPQIAQARQKAAALKLTTYEGSLKSMETRLADYDRLAARASGINFKQATDQAGAPDTELAYINGLINQVETIAHLLERYGVVGLKRGDANVQVARMKDAGDSMGFSFNWQQLLTTRQLGELPAQLVAAVEKVGFSAFDQKANVGLRAFIDAEMAKFRAAFSAPAYGLAGSQLITAADIEAMTADVAKIAPTQDEFNRKMWDTFRLPAFSRLEMNIGYETNSGTTKADLGLLTKLAGDSAVLAAGRLLTDTISRKVAENKAYVDEKDRKQAEENKKMTECAEKRGVWASGTCNIMTAQGGLPNMPGAGSQSGMPGGTGPQGGAPTGMPQGIAPTGMAQGNAASGTQRPAGQPQPGPQMAGATQPGAPAQGAATQAGSPSTGQMSSASPALQQAGSPGPGLPPTAMGGGAGQGQVSGQPPGGSAGQAAIGMQKASPSPAASPSAPGVTAMPAGQAAPGSGPGSGSMPQSGVGGAPTQTASQSSAGTGSMPPATIAQRPGTAPLPSTPVAQPGISGPGAASGPATMPQSGMSGLQAQGSMPAQGQASQPGASGAPKAAGLATAGAPTPTASMATAPASATQAARPATTTATAAKPVDKELEAQWKEMNKADAKPPVSVGPAATPARPGTTPAITGAAATAPLPQGSGVATAPTQAAPVVDATPAIRDLYQKFAEAYQRKDARGMTKYLADQWQGPGGLSAHDFEEGLSASFKTFETLQFKLEGLQIQKTGADAFNVSYAAGLSARNSKEKVDEKVNVQDVVKVTADGPRIVKTTGSLIIKGKDPVATANTAPAQPAAVVDATPAVRELYQKFAEAYQRKDARGMTKFLADQWQGPGGVAVHDFEDELTTAFKTFETIQFKLDGLQIQKAATDTFNVSYSASLSARSGTQKVDDKVNVQDVVKITAEGPRIVKTTGSLVIKAKTPGPAAGPGPTPGQAAQATPTAQTADATPAVRELYQKFAEAYQRKDVRGMTKFLADQWQGPGGMAVHDFEDELTTAFKTFETIQFKMDGLQIQKAAADTFNVSYAASLSARNAAQKLDDKVNVQDVVKITAEGPRIVKTTGSLVIKAKTPGPAAGPGPTPGQAAQATPTAQTADATPAVRELYQKFAEAYQRKDARGMTKFLADQWQGPGGMSTPDFEDGLSASFKTFDSIQFKMEGLQIQKAGADSFNVSYSASLSGKSSKQNLKVDDRVNILDVVKITAEGPRIVKTTGSVVMKPK